MSYRLEIRADALADIEEAARWYDERESGLGFEFAREVIEAIDALQSFDVSRSPHAEERSLEAARQDFLTESYFESWTT